VIWEGVGSGGGIALKPRPERKVRQSLVGLRVDDRSAPPALYGQWEAGEGKRVERKLRRRRNSQKKVKNKAGCANKCKKKKLTKGEEFS